MRIALLNPPFLFPVRRQVVLSHCLGLRYLSAFLKRNQHEVVFVDALMQGFERITEYDSGFRVGLAVQDIVDRIPLPVDLIGLSVPFSQLAPIAHEIAAAIKERLPSTPLVMGGVYPSTQPQSALSSDADLIVVGEGELAIAALADGVDAEEAPGVYSRASRELASFPPARLVQDLDELPFPDYSVPMMDRYFELSPRMARGKTASIFTSRGCPFACEFCSVRPVYGRGWRGRSAQHVLEELDYLVRDHQVRGLEIEDDNFTLNRDRAMGILEGIIRLNEQGAGIHWGTPNGVRIDTLDEEVLRTIRRANCQELVLALEHGDPEMLRIMNKGLDLDGAFTVLEQAVRCGIPLITLFLIAGYPGETRAHFERGLRFLERVRRLGGNVELAVNFAQPYPGAELLARCQREGYLVEDNIADFLHRPGLMSTGHTVSITTPDFDVAEVMRRRGELIELFGTPPWKRALKKLLPDSAIRAIRRVRRRAPAPE